MDDIKLPEKIDQLFAFWLSTLENRPALIHLYRALKSAQQKLKEPMRVAIVGLIKAGKSTTMNALLGENLVAVGTVEATFNVNWFKYGEESRLRVNYKDGKPPEFKSFEELTALTLRADENRDLLLSIKHIEVFYPNKILKELNLIDTPGLASFYQDDANNTSDFLKLHGDKLTQATQSEASNADAVIFMFTKSVSESLKDVMSQFQGASGGQTTPLNAIGVLTRIDDYWSEGDDPLEKGKSISQRLQKEHLHLRNVLYTILPICGLLALGAQTLTQNEFITLTKLALLDQERFEKLIANAERFEQREYPHEPNIPTVAERKPVYDRLGQYGVWLSCDFIRSGVKDFELLKSKLLEKSGIQELYILIISHFGNRAFLIKLNSILQQIQTACFIACQQLDGGDRHLAAQIASDFGSLEDDEHSLQELKLLRSFYEKNLNFNDDEAKQLLAVTGENGMSAEARLGVETDTPLSEMITAAKKQIRYWNERANDYLGADSQTIDAARVLAHSYERILYELKHKG